MRRAFQMELKSPAPAVPSRPRRTGRGILTKISSRMKRNRIQGEWSGGEDSGEEDFMDSPEHSSNGWREWRQIVYVLLTDPASSWLAWCVSLLMIILVLLSSATFCIETLPDLSPDVEYFLGVVEWVSVLSFTVEYVLKMMTSPNLWEALKDPFNIIDMLSIVPFYVSLGIDPKSTMPWEQSSTTSSGATDTRIIRIVRLVRVFRVLKLGKRISKVEVIISSVLESWDMLVMLVFLLMMATVICSALIYYAEHAWWDRQIEADTLDPSLLGPNGDQNPFGSIPECFWWCIVTLMTVGYGDVVPQTSLGKLVACFAMLVSIVIMALPISVIGASFTQHWTAYKSQEGVLERTQRVLPCCKETRRSLFKHNTVLENFVTTLHSLTQRVDVAMVGFRQESDRLLDAHEVLQKDTSVSNGGNAGKLSRRTPSERTSLSSNLEDRLRRTVSMNRQGHQVAAAAAAAAADSEEFQTAAMRTCKAGFMANRSWMVLNDLQQLSKMTQSEVAKIERAHFAYKGLKKWYDEGNVLQREITELLGTELKEVQAFLQEQVATKMSRAGVQESNMSFSSSRNPSRRPSAAG